MANVKGNYDARLNLKLSAESVENVKLLARAKGTSVSELIMILIDNACKKNAAAIEQQKNISVDLD